MRLMGLDFPVFWEDFQRVDYTVSGNSYEILNGMSEKYWNSDQDENE